MRFLKRIAKKSSGGSGQIEKDSRVAQRRLEEVRSTPQQAQGLGLVSEVSIKHLEDDVSRYLKDFHLYVERARETTLGLEELSKLVKSGEISESAYKLIIDELGTQLALSIDDIFRIRKALELSRAKARLEWAKEKVSSPTSQPSPTAKSEPKAPIDLRYVKAYSDILQSDYFSDEDSRTKYYSMGLEKWEDLISKIDSALSSLPIEDETAIIEQYLSIIREKRALGSKISDIENGISVCQQRLNLLSEHWASMRRSQIEKIMDLEHEASRLRDEIKELEVRFSVGEIVQQIFEIRMSAFQANLKKTEKQISDVRAFIDDMDMKIFRCLELVRENQ